MQNLEKEYKNIKVQMPQQPLQVTWDMITLVSSWKFYSVILGADDLNLTLDLLGELWEDIPDLVNSQCGEDYSLLRTVVVNDGMQNISHNV